MSSLPAKMKTFSILGKMTNGRYFTRKLELMIVGTKLQIELTIFIFSTKNSISGLKQKK